jgi:hypothetical protein
MNDNPKEFVQKFIQAVMEDVAARNPPANGDMVAKALLREVLLEHVERMKAEYMTIIARYDDDPEEQRRQAIMLDDEFISLERAVEEAFKK